MANNNGKKKALPVVGYEQLVGQMIRALEYFKDMKAELDMKKDVFRNYAAEAVKGHDGVTTLEFQDGKGRAIGVSLPDITQPGNRLALKPEAIAESGLELDGLTEVEETVVLKGSFVGWFKQLLTQWEEAGQAIPDDGAYDLKSVIKLTVDGHRKLAARPEAAEFVKSATKAAAIKVK